MRSFSIPAVLALALSFTGCSWFEDPSPDNARVVVQGRAGGMVRLTTSSKFVSGVNELGVTRVVVFESDSLVRAVPFDAEFRIRGDNRFFAEARWIGQDVDSIRVRVYLDDRVVFDESGPLINGSPYRFVWTLNQAVTQLIEVIF